MNTATRQLHSDFLKAVGLYGTQEYGSVMTGGLTYESSRVATDGSQGVYRYGLDHDDVQFSFSDAARVYTVLAASMPLLDDNLAWHVRNLVLPQLQSDLPSIRDSRDRPPVRRRRLRR